MNTPADQKIEDLFTPCRTGQHLWYFPEDAAMCCNGFKQEIVFDPEQADTWLYLFGCGYKWVKENP